LPVGSAAADALIGALAARLAGRSGLRLERGAPLAPLTTLRIGGPAELLVEARAEPDLACLLRAAGELGVPWFLLGWGSNVLIPDEGVAGAVVRLGEGFGRAAIRGPRVVAGAAVSLPRLALRSAAAGLVGLEGFAGFPSSVGGAVAMNAGCYGTEVKDVLVSVKVVERDGTRRRLPYEALEPGYRSTNLRERGAIVTRAHFLLRPGEPGAARARIEELRVRRRGALPTGRPNAGSVFKNPPGDYAGRLIEAAGLKGRQEGAAQISERHANVIVNLGGATAADVLALMLAAHRAVRDRFGVSLEPEWILAGALAARWRETTAGTGAPRETDGEART
jgi:UDP-N-acetylmuramate dehydrogenase